jgi:2-amino-4-hydroxy-6-hydroxymethyldihydropteridine diphosphokinase
MMIKVYLGLGYNMGDRADHLRRARECIRAIAGVVITRASSLYLTAPWGKTDQEDFVNQVIEIETDLEPLELLHELQDIEIKLGRQREEFWGPRIIDLDVLLYGREIITLGELQVPHPYMLQRLFVLVPLAEIAPELVLPDGSKIQEVLTRVESRLDGNYIQKL